MTETALGIDTNLFIRQAARRMLGACCERTRTRIYVPGQTLREAPEKVRTLYGRAAARMSARTPPGRRRARGSSARWRPSKQCAPDS